MCKSFERSERDWDKLLVQSHMGVVVRGKEKGLGGSKRGEGNQNQVQSNVWDVERERDMV